MTRGLVIATAVLVIASEAIQVQVKQNNISVFGTVGETSDVQDTVCVSIAVYEPAEWVNRLLDNFLKFAEPSTRIVLHLDAKSEYSEEQINKWDACCNNRVATTRNQRARVRKFYGSLLWAHLLNAQTMSQRWNQASEGGECAFFLYQASNMMWVRRGFEAEVRNRRYSQVRKIEDGGCSAGNIPLSQSVRRPTGLYARGQAEGGFWPMAMVQKIWGRKNEWIHPVNDTVDVTLVDIGNIACSIPCTLEDYTFQTYALNNEEPILRKSSFYQESKPLSWNHITHGDDEEHDSVPFEEVKLISEAHPEWSQYYAVKRVVRDLNHPTTQFIHSLI